MIEQVQKRLLPNRGICAAPEQILITSSSQQSLFLLGSLLLNQQSTLGMESPGNLTMRNIATLKKSTIKGLHTDQNGLIISHASNACDVIYIAPDHHTSTQAAMPTERRYSLLQQAIDADFLLIEDDQNNNSAPHAPILPTLKSIDHSNRAIYINGISSDLLSGLGLSYIVGSTELIRELRALQRILFNHQMTSDEHATALFIARGYYETLASKQTDHIVQ